MYISGDCIGCGVCVSYCPQEAITLNGDRADIDRKCCVECGVCVDTDICPTGSICEDTDVLASTKKIFGRLIESMPGSGVKGRSGNFDVKRNDVTKRIPPDKVVIRLELMRPKGGVTIRTAEELRAILCQAGFAVKPTKRHELFLNLKDELPSEMIDQKMLTTSFEIVSEPSNVPSITEIVDRFGRSKEIHVSVNLACVIENLDNVKRILSESGITISQRAKINLGIGRKTEI